MDSRNSQYPLKRWLVAVILSVLPGITASVFAADDAACRVKELKRSTTSGAKVYAPDGHRFLINKEDDNHIAQVYVGQTGSSTVSCITCDQRAGGPAPQRFKMQAQWHPSGRWIFMAVERDTYSPPPVLGS